jgi:hypothetical protein
MSDKKEKKIVKNEEKNMTGYWQSNYITFAFKTIITNILTDLKTKTEKKSVI